MSAAEDHGPGEPVGWSRAQAAYRDGARVLQRLGAKFVDWSLPTPCPGWAAIDLVGHLLCTARAEHRLLDAALAGEPFDDLPAGARLDAANADALAALPVASGGDRVVAFDAVTTRYAERLAEVEPDLVLGGWEGIGRLTVAARTQRTATEWHVHAWDLASALGWDYRPADPGALDPEGWTALLGRYGRRPPGEPRPLGP